MYVGKRLLTIHLYFILNVTTYKLCSVCVHWNNFCMTIVNDEFMGCKCFIEAELRNSPKPFLRHYAFVIRIQPQLHGGVVMVMVMELCGVQLCHDKKDLCE